MGATVAGLKICEDLLPEQVKEWLPSWFKKGNAQKQESNNFSDNTINEHTSEDATQYPAADQVDNINLGEKVDSLGKEMHGQSAAPTTGKSEPVEPYEMESTDHQNMLQAPNINGSENILPEHTEMSENLNTAPAESDSVNNTHDNYSSDGNRYPNDIEDDGRINYILLGAVGISIATLGIGGIIVAVPTFLRIRQKLQSSSAGSYVKSVLSSLYSFLYSSWSSWSSSWSQSSVASPGFSSMDSSSFSPSDSTNMDWSPRPDLFTSGSSISTNPVALSCLDSDDYGFGQTF